MSDNLLLHAAICFILALLVAVLFLVPFAHSVFYTDDRRERIRWFFLFIIFNVLASVFYLLTVYPKYLKRGRLGFPVNGLSEPSQPHN
jgi:hypothetical protein